MASNLRLQDRGVKEGMRVAFLADTSLEALETLLGIWERGAVACPINPRIPLARREEMLKQLDPVFFLDGEEERASCPPAHKGSELAALLFTSGSTGKPKIAGLTHRNLLLSASGSALALGLGKSDCWHLSLPLYHVGGLGTIVRCLLAGAKVGLNEEKATLLSLVPTQLFRMLKSKDPALLHKKAIVIGGAPIAEHLLQQASGLPICTTWGMTEASSMVTLNGHLLPNREAKIAPDGEIHIRGGVLFQGYLQEDGRFHLPLSDGGWFATGDLGCWDPQGRLHWKGRKDRLFIAFGENIQPEEIEQELLKLPGVIQAIVTPVSDPEAGALPIAYLETEGPFQEDLWRYHLKEHLPSFKIPRLFLPLSSPPDLKPKLY